MKLHIIRRLTPKTFISLICCLISLDRAQAQAPVETAWISAASGNWTDIFRWNTFGFLPYPNNDEMDTFNVLIALDASPQITLDADITIENLHLASSFIAGGNTLTPREGFIWRGGGFNGGNGSLHSLKPIQMSGGQKFLRGFHVYSHIETSWVSGNVDSRSGGVFHNQPDSTFNVLFDGDWEAESGLIPAEFINLGQFIKTQSIGITHMGPDFTNTGDVLVETGTLKFSGRKNNLGNIQASDNSLLEFAGGYTSVPESSLVSRGSVRFNSAQDVVEIRGLFDVGKETDFAAKQTFLYPEAQLKSLGDTVYIRNGNTQFDTQETVGVKELFLVERGQLLGSDPISVQNRFIWSNGTTLSGDSPLYNVTLAEWIKLETSELPRILGERPFVNFGKVEWSGGDMLMSSDATIVNQNGAEFTIQKNIIAGALNEWGKASFLNQGTLNVANSASSVILDLNLVNKGTVHFPNGRMIISGHIQVEGGTLTSENAIISTPAMSLRNGTFRGSAILQGHLDISQKTAVRTAGSGLQVRGNMECAPDAEFILSVSEEQAQHQIPPLDITGTASLGGAMLIEFKEDWQPESGHRIPVLKSKSIAGKFRNIFPFRLNETISLMPVYEDEMLWLMPFYDGGELPALNVFLLNNEVLLTWPRHLSNYRVQARGSVFEGEWTTLKKTLVNYMKLPIEDAGMTFRLIRADAL
jgi:hypothetical protein